MAGLTNNENMNLGGCLNISTQKVHCHDYVVEISMRSLAQKESREDSLSLFGQCRILGRHCCIVACGLGCQGNIFTWNNGRFGDALVQEWLYRTYATFAWRDLFPHVKVNHIQTSYSNHVPVLISTSKSTNPSRRRKLLRRFDEKWASHLECKV